MDHLSRLLVAAQDGDAIALDRFVAETQGEVWNLCRYLGDARDADDLAQEVYERAIKSLPRFRADGTARAWLLTIARRVCSDHVRRAQRRRRNDQIMFDEAQIESGDLRDATRGVDLDDLLRQLDDDRRAAFVLTQVLGLYYDEAAEILGCPTGTIRSRVSRARIQLAAMTERLPTDSDLDETGTM